MEKRHSKRVNEHKYTCEYMWLVCYYGVSYLLRQVLKREYEHYTNPSQHIFRELRKIVSFSLTLTAHSVSRLTERRFELILQRTKPIP